MSPLSLGCFELPVNKISVSSALNSLISASGSSVWPPPKIVAPALWGLGLVSKSRNVLEIWSLSQWAGTSSRVPKFPYN